MLMSITSNELNTYSYNQYLASYNYRFQVASYIVHTRGNWLCISLLGDSGVYVIVGAIIGIIIVLLLLFIILICCFMRKKGMYVHTCSYVYCKCT